MTRPIQLVFAFQALALAVAAWFFRHALNTDAVAYLQLARHYADGNFGLAVSGHWSPLISWAVALLLKLGVAPLVAGRLFMVASGIVFLWGGLQLFRQFELPRPAMIWGLWIMAWLSIPWSVENITPDLLLAGLVSWAVSQTATSRWWQKPSSALGVGATWGLAFLCKAPALPLGILTLIGATIWWWRNTSENRKKVRRALGLALAGMALVAGPWVGVLTAHYGKLTVANSASYNHSLLGPGVEQGLFLLDHGLQIPPTGRVTIWEDPVTPYPDWSPFSGADNAVRQLKIMGRNVPVALVMITSVSLLFPVVAAMALVCMARRGDKISWLAFLPVLILAVLFLPNYLLISEQRYFYATAPLLFVVAADYAVSTRWTRTSLMLLAFCFLAPNLARAGLYLGSTRRAADYTYALAERIAPKHLAGPVVGSGRMPGGRAGLNLAWLLQQPWYGDEPLPAAHDYQASGARLIVVNRGSPVAADLAASQGIRNLDGDLFSSPANAAMCPIQLFTSEETQRESK